MPVPFGNFIRRLYKYILLIITFAAIGRVVQLDRISDFGSEGWGFESSRGH